RCRVIGKNHGYIERTGPDENRSPAAGPAQDGHTVGAAGVDPDIVGGPARGAQNHGKIGRFPEPDCRASPPFVRLDQERFVEREVLHNARQSQLEADCFVQETESWWVAPTLCGCAAKRSAQKPVSSIRKSWWQSVHTFFTAPKASLAC